MKSNGFPRISVAVPIAICCVAAFAGCAGPKSSPETTFKSLQTAAANRRWNDVLAAFTPGGREKFLSIHLAVMAMAGLLDKEASDILSKHGVSVLGLAGQIFGESLQKKQDLNAVATEAFRQQIAGIKDQAAFLGDVQGWLEQKGLGDRTFVHKLPQLQLVRVEYVQDRAIGHLSENIAPGVSSLQFHRIGTQWLIEL